MLSIWTELEGLHSWSVRQLTETLLSESSQCYVLESAELEVLGFAMFECVASEASLLNIVIKEVARTNGNGELLLVQAMDHLKCQGNDRFLLEVRASNTTALSLYRKLGFTEDGVRKNYYEKDSGKEHAVLMSVTQQGKMNEYS